MSTGSVSGPRPQSPTLHTAAAGPSAPAQAQAPVHTQAASQVGAALPVRDAFAAGGPASATAAAGSSAAARPGTDRAALRTRGAEPDTRPNPRENPQVFDRQGRMSPDGLRGLTQTDNDGNTTGDASRCSANSSVAALAMRGNQAMMQGFLNAAVDVARQMGQTTDPQRIGELALAHGTLMGLAAKAGTNNIQRSDLNTAADALWKTYDSDRTDPTNIMTYPDIAKMNQALGLVPSSTTGEQGVLGPKVGEVSFSTVPPNRGAVVNDGFNTNSPQFRDAQRRAANDVVGRLQPGDTALVGIFNPAPGATGTDRPNHIINVGKNAQGQMYLYDPANSPNYMTGRDAENHLRSHMGISLQNPRMEANNTRETYDVRVAATIMPQNRTIAANP